MPASHGIQYQPMSERDVNKSPWGLKPMGGPKAPSMEVENTFVLTFDQVEVGEGADADSMALAFRDSKLFPKLTEFLGEIQIPEDINYGEQKLVNKGKYSWFGFLDMHGPVFTEVLGSEIPDWRTEMLEDPQKVLNEASEKLDSAGVMSRPVLVGDMEVPFAEVYWTMVNGMQAASGAKVTPRQRKEGEAPPFSTKFDKTWGGKSQARITKNSL